MCLVIMYGINKDADVSLMEKMFYFQFDSKPMVNEFELIGEGLDRYNFFNMGACNCGSYITMLKDSKADNFNDYYSELKQSLSKRIEAVNKLRSDPKYEKLVSKFKKEFEKKRKEMQKYSVSDTKRMQEYEAWLNKNQVFKDDLLGGLVNDNAESIVNSSIEDLINQNVVDAFDKDTSIIDGVFTSNDEVLIIPIWTDGSASYKVSYSDINYDDLDYNKLAKLTYNHGFRIHA